MIVLPVSTFSDITSSNVFTSFLTQFYKNASTVPINVINYPTSCSQISMTIFAFPNSLSATSTNRPITALKQFNRYLQHTAIHTTTNIYMEYIQRTHYLKNVLILKCLPFETFENLRSD